MTNDVKWQIWKIAEAAIAALLKHGSIVEAADAGTSSRTLLRWLRDPEFRADHLVVTIETWELLADGKTLTRTITSSGMVSLNLKYVHNSTS